VIGNGLTTPKPITRRGTRECSDAADRKPYRERQRADLLAGVRLADARGTDAAAHPENAA